MNAIGVVHTTNVFLPLIRAGITRKLILISSGVADPDFILATDLAMFAPYAMSKAAANMAFTKYAAEYRKDGLIFLSISPGFVNTAAVKPRTYAGIVNLML